MRPLFAMARVTFAETIRQPFFGLVVIGTLGALALGPALAMFSLEDDRPLLKDFGVSTVFLAGSILAAFGASTILAREFERHTLQTILSKPVSRAALLLGKLLGLLAALALAACLGKAREIELVFEKGRLYVRRSTEGVLLVVMGLIAPTGMVRLRSDILLSGLKETTPARGIKRFFRR